MGASTTSDSLKSLNTVLPQDSGTSQALSLDIVYILYPFI